MGLDMYAFSTPLANVKGQLKALYGAVRRYENCFEWVGIGRLNTNRSILLNSISNGITIIPIFLSNL